MDTPVLRADTLNKTLVMNQGADSGPNGPLTILKQVSLTVPPAGSLAITGASGSGKSTLLGLLAGLDEPSSGSVELFGESLSGKTEDQRAALRLGRVGFVFQSYNLFPTLTATENVKLALDVRGHSGKSATEMATTALKAVGLGHRLDAYPRSMSGGEQQRVAIARALAGSPAVILADEPTAALDSKNGLAVMALIQELSRDESRVVLAVTHDGRTLPYADRIITIEDGRIVDDRRQKPTAGPAATKAAAKTSKKKA